MTYFLKTLFFILLFVSGLTYLFYNENTFQPALGKKNPPSAKVSKTDIPKVVPKTETKKSVRKITSLEKPAAVQSSAFAGLNSFGPSNGNAGIISHSDQIESASGSFSNSKSAQSVDIEILNKIDPLFPEVAKKKNITGYVRLLITVDPTSAVKSVEILEAQPEGYFETAAIEAVRKWKFKAAYQNGSPVESNIKRRIEFKLE